MSKHLELLQSALSVWRVPFDLVQARRQLRDAMGSKGGAEGADGDGLMQARQTFESAQLRLKDAQTLVLIMMSASVLASFIVLFAIKPVLSPGGLQPLSLAPLMILAVSLAAMTVTGLSAWYCHRQIQSIQQQQPDGADQGANHDHPPQSMSMTAGELQHKMRCDFDRRLSVVEEAEEAGKAKAVGDKGGDAVGDVRSEGVTGSDDASASRSRSPSGAR